MWLKAEFVEVFKLWLDDLVFSRWRDRHLVAMIARSDSSLSSPTCEQAVPERKVPTIQVARVHLTEITLCTGPHDTTHTPPVARDRPADQPPCLHDAFPIFSASALSRCNEFALQHCRGGILHVPHLQRHMAPRSGYHQERRSRHPLLCLLQRH